MYAVGRNDRSKLIRTTLPTEHNQSRALGINPDMANANLIYNLADFLNKIAFGLAIYVAAVSDND